MIEFGDPRLPVTFWAKVMIVPGGCWIWTGSITVDGYGQWGGRDRRSGLAHRHLFLTLVGPASEGIDHLCHSRVIDLCPGGRACLHRRCVNPAHLESTTISENVSRGLGPSALNARKDECISGHPFDAANTYWPKRGGRQCRACRANRERERTAKKSSAWHARQNARRSARRRVGWPHDSGA